MKCKFCGKEIKEGILCSIQCVKDLLNEKLKEARELSDFIYYYEHPKNK